MGKMINFIKIWKKIKNIGQPYIFNSKTNVDSINLDTSTTDKIKIHK